MHTEATKVRNFPVTVFYSQEDDGFVAVVPDLPGCSAFGGTPEDAVHEAYITAEIWLEVALEEHRPLPIPRPLPFQAAG